MKGYAKKKTLLKKTDRNYVIKYVIINISLYDHYF